MLKIEKEVDNRIEFFTKVNKKLLDKARKKKKEEGHTWQEIIEAGFMAYLNERRKGK